MAQSAWLACSQDLWHLLVEVLRDFAAGEGQLVALGVSDVAVHVQNTADDCSNAGVLDSSHCLLLSSNVLRCHVGGCRKTGMYSSAKGVANSERGANSQSVVWNAAGLHVAG
jgi:hypothetical protein